MVTRNPEEERPEESPGTDEELEGINQLAELQKMIEAVENRLATTLGEAISNINKRLDENATAAAALQSNAKAALEAMPKIVQENVEGQMKANLKGIIEEIGSQLEGKFKDMITGGVGADGGGFSFRELMANSDKIVNVVNAFRSPTTEQAMMAQMNFVMKWHSLLTKLEKGGGSGDDVTKAIASTFTQE